MIIGLLILPTLIEAIWSKNTATMTTDETFDQFSSAVERFLIQKKTPDQSELTYIITHLYHKIRKNSEVGVQALDIDKNIHKIAVVGDLHGDAESAKQIAQKILLNKTFMDSGMVVFLGDYVDRGKHGLNVLASILAAKIMYNNRVLIIRGNHEFEALNYRYGFFDEVTRVYGKDLYNTTIAPLFKLLPISYVISITKHSMLPNRLLFLHGGLPRNSTLDTLISKCKVDFPHDIDVFDPRYTKLLENCLPVDVVQDIVWSDPVQLLKNDTLKEYTKNPRGAGILYSYEFYKKFAAKNRVVATFRGHQVVKGGFQRDFSNHYTVFSSSNYVNMKNKGAYIVIDIDCIRSAINSSIDMINFQEHMETDLIRCIHPHATTPM